MEVDPPTWILVSTLPPVAEPLSLPILLPILRDLLDKDLLRSLVLSLPVDAITHIGISMTNTATAHAYAMAVRSLAHPCNSRFEVEVVNDVPCDYIHNRIIPHLALRFFLESISSPIQPPPHPSAQQPLMDPSPVPLLARLLSPHRNPEAIRKLLCNR